MARHVRDEAAQKIESPARSPPLVGCPLQPKLLQRGLEDLTPAFRGLVVVSRYAVVVDKTEHLEAQARAPLPHDLCNRLRHSAKELGRAVETEREPVGPKQPSARRVTNAQVVPILLMNGH